MDAGVDGNLRTGSRTDFRITIKSSNHSIQYLSCCCVQSTDRQAVLHATLSWSLSRNESPLRIPADYGLFPWIVIQLFPRFMVCAHVGVNSVRLYSSSHQLTFPSTGDKYPACTTPSRDERKLAPSKGHFFHCSELCVRMTHLNSMKGSGDPEWNRMDNDALSGEGAGVGCGRTTTTIASRTNCYKST